MKNRTIQLLQLRPAIESIEDQAVSAEEMFQNNSLRPILKYQNDLLLSIFKAQIIKRKISFQQLSKEKQTQFIEDALKKDISFRNLMIGTIVGHFSLEEWTTYLPLERALNKRIITMLIQRIDSQKANLV